MNTAAAIYIGAYTIQMLIAHLHPDKEPEIINEFTACTRIGEDLALTNLLTESGMKLAEKALREMHRIAEDAGVTECRIAASGSLRNAANRTSLLLLGSKEFGVYPQLLSTKDEARLHFMGTVTGEFAELPIIVAYIGHYGVRAACGTMKRIDVVSEIPVGPGILNKKYHLDTKTFNFFSMIPIRAFLTSQFQSFSNEVSAWKRSTPLAPELFLVGPFPTSYVSLALKMPVTDKNNIPSMPFPKSDLADIVKKLMGMKQEDRENIPYLDKNMTANIASCAVIQKAIVDSCGLDEFHISPNGLCMGLLKAPASFTASGKV